MMIQEFRSVVYFSLLATSILSTAHVVTAVEQVRSYVDTPKEQANRMQWWHNAKFGMFIHFGPSAVAGGEHNGVRYRHIAEWIMHNAKIPIEEYRECYIDTFNPVNFNPDDWMRAAAGAGMKYMVVTTKHHDGFAMFDSQVDDFNIVDATPYGKDIIGPLLEAARRHGIRPGIYYSQCLDWSHPGGRLHDEGKGPWDPAQKGDFIEYVKNTAYPQMEELFTNYGELASLWWDFPREMNDEAVDILKEVLQLQPQIITNDRLPRDRDRGDYKVQEGRVPPPGFNDPDYAWETCYNMNNSWGYRKGLTPSDWKSSAHLIEKLAQVVSSGGNLLLNVGPNPEGELQPEELKRLKDIGHWMKENSESIYGTTKNPLRYVTGGYATYKAEENAIYLLLAWWPKLGVFSVPGLRNKVVSATLLADGTDLQVIKNMDGWPELRGLPKESPSEGVGVIKIVINGTPDVDPVYPQPDTVGIYKISVDELALNLTGYGAPIIRSEDSLTNWMDHRAYLKWTMNLKKTGWYQLVMDARFQGDRSPNMTVHIGDMESGLIRSRLKDSHDWQKVEFAPLQLQQGLQDLILNVARGSNVSVRNLRLVPSTPGKPE